MVSVRKTPFQRLLILDGLRGIAAIVVMFHHEPRPYGDLGIFSRAYLAVDFFFLLSGFVLTLAFEPRMKAGLGTEAFLRMRVRRLWPLMLIGIFIGAIASLRVVSPATAAQFVFLAVLLFPIVKGASTLFPVNGPMWSLFFELVANVCQSLGLRRLGDKALLAVAIFFGVSLVPMALDFGTVGAGDVGETWWGGFIRIGFAYTLGCWMARRYRDGKGRGGQVWWLPIFLFLGALTLAPAVPVPRAWTDFFIVTIVLPAVLWLAVNARLPDRVTAPMKMLGDLSYPLYVTHLPVLNLGLWAALELGPRYYSAVRITAVITALGLAWWLAHTPLARGMTDKPRKQPNSGSYQAAAPASSG